MTTTDNARARSQAVSQLEAIREMVAALRRSSDRIDWNEEAERLGFALVTVPDEFGDQGDTVEMWRKDEDGPTFDDAEEACRSVGEYLDEDEARDRIHEDPLSIQVRGGWRSPGEPCDGAEEYEILLCTGGPAVRIRGDLDRGEPSSAVIEYQDWFTPWMELVGPGLPDDWTDDVLTYAQTFYFGE